MIWPAAAKAESMKRGLVARLKVGPFPFVHKSTSRSPEKTIKSAISPADADGDWTEVRGDACVAAVDVAKLGVDIHIGADLAGDAAAEAFAELVHAGVEEVSVDG